MTMLKKNIYLFEINILVFAHETVSPTTCDIVNFENLIAPTPRKIKKLVHKLLIYPKRKVCTWGLNPPSASSKDKSFPTGF